MIDTAGMDIGWCELVEDARLIAHNPGIMAGLNDAAVAGTPLVAVASRRHCDVHTSRLDKSNVTVLTTVHLDQRLDVGAPPPARLEDRTRDPVAPWSSQMLDHTECDTWMRAANLVGL